MPLSTGQVLQNRYRIVRLIGQGGFGAVYRAWDLSLNKPCALKENFDISEEARRQFQREALVMATLAHPNLPRVTDHFYIPGQGQYLVMDFVEGQSLDQVLAARQGALEESEALPWIAQICDALEYLHSRNPPIIHRDIKPENIIITPEGRAMLVDFGISKVYDPTLRTTIGAKAVTPGYSPPEQYGGGTTDARTDIYALGATLYRLLTNQDPPESVQRVVGAAALTEPRKLNKTLSPALERVILQATQVNTTQRFQSVAEMRAALAAGQIAAGAERERKRPFPIWLWLILGTAVVGLLAVGGSLLVRGGLPGASPPPVATRTSRPTGTTAVGTTAVGTTAVTDTPTSAAPTGTATRAAVPLIANTATATATQRPSATPSRTATAVSNTPRPSATNTLRPSATPSATATAAATATRTPAPVTATPLPPTNTAVPPTPVPPTNTAVPPTPVPPTNTAVPPTAPPPTDTPVPPTVPPPTVPPPTDTPIPPTDTPEPPPPTIPPP